MIVKEVKHYPDTNSVEATWIERTITPAIGIDGEEGYQPEQVIDTAVRCHSYADVQMDMLEADLGADAAEHAALIATVRASYVPPPPPAVTTADYTRAVQAALDSKAGERNYDGILSACTYVTSNVPKFQAEGAACVAWRDAVWAYCYDMLAQVQAQTLPQPTVAELVAGMPQLTWPV